MPMPRWARRSLIVLGCLCVLLIAAAVAVPFFIDVNRYRPMIAERLEQATGRKVTLGPIALRLLPAPTLSVAPLAIAESPRYPGRDALRAKSLAIRIAPLALLKGRVAVRSIVMQAPELTLIRDASGTWSFDDLIQRAEKAPQASPPPTGADAPGGISVTVESAAIHSGRLVVYDDAVVPGSRSELTLAPIDATLRGWGPGEETHIELAAGLGRSQLEAAALLATGGGGSRIEAEARGRDLRAQDLVLLLPWLGVTRPKGMEVDGSLDIEGDARLPLDRPEAISFKGTVRLKGISYKDAMLLQPVKNVSGRLTVDGDHAVWDDFNVSIAGSSLSGRLQVVDFLRPRVGFALTSKNLDFNAILAALEPAAASPPASGNLASAVGGSALLDQISAQGTLSMDAIRFQTFDLTGFSATVDFAHGVLALKDLKAAFYGGGIEGSARVDLRPKEPAYRLETRLGSVEVNPLIAAYDPALKDLLRGRLSGRLEVSASGADMQPILASASGAGALQMTDGAITSFSVLKQLASVLELAGGKGIGKDETPFEYLRGTLAIGSGRATTEDLELHAADLDLFGRGWIGLDTALNLAVTASFSQESTRGMVDQTARLASLTGTDGRLAVHLLMAGSLAAPRVRLDTKAQVRDVEVRKKEEVRDKVKGSILRRLGLGGKPAEEETPVQEAPQE